MYEAQDVAVHDVAGVGCVPINCGFESLGLGQVRNNKWGDMVDVFFTFSQALQFFLLLH